MHLHRMKFKLHYLRNALTLLFALPFGYAAAIPEKCCEQTCQRTSVVILGAGIAGITAAQALYNQSIDDFILVEYKGEIGGRVHHEEFGVGPDGYPMLVEYGANWIQGISRDGISENPIWTREKKWGIRNHESDGDSIMTFDEMGYVNYTDEIDEFDLKMDELKKIAGKILSENLQDMTVREGLGLVGWKPDQRTHPMHSAAAEWWLYDGEQVYTPEESSLVFGAAVSNFTFVHFANKNNFVTDQRGHNYWIKAEAEPFLGRGHTSRLLLNTVVKNITYSDDSVTVIAEDGTCIQADYAICTFSIGVLQHPDAVTFSPALPSWKQTAIEMFQMGTYTKIFMQFPYTFWDNTTEFFLYADPFQRGWYPIWQSLDKEGFFPGSHVLFVTVVGREAYRVERQAEEDTLEAAMKVLRSMFPDIEVPDPVAFAYPRWTMTPWAYGSFSNWPPGTTLEMHQNLRANVGRLWFAGEHTSTSYFGYMQGAWFEGQNVGTRIAGLLGGVCEEALPGSGGCGEMAHYEVLHGTTDLSEYTAKNGWDEVAAEQFVEENP